MPLQFERAASLFSSVGGVRPFRYNDQLPAEGGEVEVFESLRFTNDYNIAAAASPHDFELRDDETVVITNFTVCRRVSSLNAEFNGLGIGYLEDGSSSGSTLGDPTVIAYNAWDVNIGDNQTPVMVTIPHPVILTYVKDFNFWGGGNLSQNQFLMVVIADRRAAAGEPIAGLYVTVSGFVIKTGSLPQVKVSVPV